MDPVHNATTCKIIAKKSINFTNCKRKLLFLYTFEDKSSFMNVYGQVNAPEKLFERIEF